MTDFDRRSGPRRASLARHRAAERLARHHASSAGARSATPRLRQPEREFTVKARSQRQIVMRRFVHHKLAMASLVVLILVFLFAFVGPVVWKYGYTERTPDASQPPSWEHPFGTDTSATTWWPRSCAAPRSRS